MCLGGWWRRDISKWGLPRRGHSRCAGASLSCSMNLAEAGPPVPSPPAAPRSFGGGGSVFWLIIRPVSVTIWSVSLVQTLFGNNVPN